MSNIITRSGQGSALTHTTMDNNLKSLSGIVNAQTGTSYTVLLTDQNGTIEHSNAAATAYTLPVIATLLASIDTSFFTVTIKNIGAGVVTITPTTDTFDDGSATKTLNQFDSITIQTDSAGTSWNVINKNYSETTKVSATVLGSIDIPQNVSTTIIFNTENFDINSEYDNTTGIFTAAQTGYYKVSSNVGVGTSTTGGDEIFVSLLKETSTIIARDYAFVTNTSRSVYTYINAIVFLNSGETIEISCLPLANSSVVRLEALLDGGGSCDLNISRVL